MTLGQFPLLALVLFTPWFLILGALFWLFPRQPRSPARRRFDVAALLLAVLAFAVATRWAFHHADPGHHLWPQVLATSVGYGVYLLVMALAAWWRHRWVIGPHRSNPRH